MEIKILAFGIIADMAKKNRWVIENAETIVQLKSILEHELPELKTMTYKISVNKKITSENIVLTHGCEVALLPPFSGG